MNDAALAALKAADAAQDCKPWDMQPGESTYNFHLFTHFRDCGPQRSLGQGYRAHQRQCLHKTKFSKKHGAPDEYYEFARTWAWLDRARAWDSEQDRLIREKILQEQVEARGRHARLCQATLQVLTAPVRAALAAATDKTLVDGLAAFATKSPLEALLLFREVAKLAAVIPGLVQMERLSLGLTAEDEAVPEPTADPGFSDRIVRNPAATDLAIALLAELAGQTTPAAPVPLALPAGIADEE